MIQRIQSWLPGIVLLAIGATAVAFEEFPDPGDEGHVLVVLPSGSEVLAELAVSPRKRARGLMYRTEIREDEGMLFVFEDSAPHGFWMKNCEVSLDLIWLDVLGRVVDVRADVPPCREARCGTVVPDAPARLVLELAAGSAAAHAIEPGTELILVGDLPLQ